MNDDENDDNGNERDRRFDDYLDGLLRSDDAAAIEAAPAEAIAAAERALAAARRRRLVRRSLSGVALAAGLAAVVAWLPLPRRGGPGEGLPSVASIPGTPERASRQATFASDGDSIVVSVESPSPEVTVVQLYPTIDAERRWRLAQILESIETQPDGGG